MVYQVDYERRCRVIVSFNSWNPVETVVEKPHSLHDGENDRHDCCQAQYHIAEPRTDQIAAVRSPAEDAVCDESSKDGQDEY